MDMREFTPHTEAWTWHLIDMTNWIYEYAFSVLKIVTAQNHIRVEFRNTDTEKNHLMVYFYFCQMQWSSRSMDSRYLNERARVQIKSWTISSFPALHSFHSEHRFFFPEFILANRVDFVSFYRYCDFWTALGSKRAWLMQRQRLLLWTFTEGVGLLQFRAVFRVTILLERIYHVREIQVCKRKRKEGSGRKGERKWNISMDSCGMVSLRSGIINVYSW